MKTREICAELYGVYGRIKNEKEGVKERKN
jgi:hypothetical protein